MKVYMKKKGILIGTSVAAILVIAFLVTTQYFNQHFLPNTTVDNVNVSNLSISDAKSKIENAPDNQKLVLYVGKEKWKTINKKPFINSSTIESKLKEAKDSQNAWTWPIAFFKQHQIQTQSIMNEDKVKNYQATIQRDIQTYNKGKKGAVNASLTFINDQIVFTKSHNGTKLDVKEATQAITNALCHNEKSINLSNTVQKPTITKNSPSLKKQVQQMEKIGSLEAYYDFNGKKVQIPQSEIKSWLMLDMNGDIALNQAKVANYVQQIANKYNTYKHDVPFKSTAEGTVKLPADVYSWSINVPMETTALSEAILAGKNFTRTPITTGSASPKGSFVGNTYIEVDLAKQHMWYYKDGKLVLDTDIVSGKPTQETPIGFYYVWNKERNKVLKGQDYASPVSYWMPINWDGVGIHDSDWQVAYGGTRWKDGFGSHGCINTPPTVMANLYNKTAVGTPVIVLK